MLFASSALQSFAVGTLTCRWAFLEARPPWKVAWALSVVLAVLIAYLSREYRTEKELKDPSAMRTAALWAARGSAIAFASSHSPCTRRALLGAEARQAANEEKAECL